MVLLKALSKSFTLVACDAVGTHPMQRLVEMINMEEEREIIFLSIREDIVKLAFHDKGNYVLFNTLNALQGERFDYIINKLISHFHRLSLD